mmetsp:Transcript_34954/g.91770  ORF Transcript_34954/g.91770 Transcript_34954/m.91770 type:complete len:253 (-) Transcript_34954:317-1075(-)
MGYLSRTGGFGPASPLTRRASRSTLASSAPSRGAPVPLRRSPSTPSRPCSSSSSIRSPSGRSCCSSAHRRPRRTPTFSTRWHPRTSGRSKSSSSLRGRPISCRASSSPSRSRRLWPRRRRSVSAICSCRRSKRRRREGAPSAPLSTRPPPTAPRAAPCPPAQGWQDILWARPRLRVARRRPSSEVHRPAVGRKPRLQLAETLCLWSESWVWTLRVTRSRAQRLRSLQGRRQQGSRLQAAVLYERKHTQHKAR